jgi:Flp pilus assembly protein TadG
MRRRTLPGRGRRDGGAVVLEVLVLAPVFFLLIDLAIYAGTAATVRSMAHHAADTAAREGSIARSGTDASQETTVASMLFGHQHFADFQCSGVVTDNTAFSAPVGQKAQVTYTVTCKAIAKGVSFPGIPTQVNYTVTATSVLDTYRWRSP